MIRALRILSLSVAALWLWQVPAYAAPGDILFEDDFDAVAGCSSLSPTWAASDTNLGGISSQTSNSGACSMFLRGDVNTISSPTIDLTSVTGATLTAWLRQGLDTFSEDVDAGEDFVFEYLNSSAIWIPISTLLGSGPNGEVTAISLDLPAAALHANFRLRFRMTGGSGGPPANGGIGYDYWHIDDVVLTETGTPPPPEPPSGLGVGQCERFESGFGNWTTTNGTRSGVNGDTFLSASNSLFLRHNAVTTTSIAFDSDSMDEIEVWIRRGADAFSENPENGENLTFQYLNASNAWVTLETFPGGGTQGEIFVRTYTIPTADWHANFRVRFNLNRGSGSDFDYWHVDDLCFNRAQPVFDVTKDVRIEWDPINEFTNPLMIPGAWAVYTLRIENTGRGRSDLDTLAIGDAVDPTISLFTGDFNGSGSPFDFIDAGGSTASGVTLDFVTLGDGSDGVTFLNSSNLSITPNGDFDPVVRGFNLSFDGEMNAAILGQTPVFEIEYRVRVE